MSKKEEKIERLNLILSTIRNVHSLLIKERNIDKLLKSICQDLIKDHGYYNAWIAVFNSNMNLEKYAQSGLEKKLASLGKLLEKERLTDCAKRALAQKSVLVTEDPSSECKDCPLSEDYSGRAAMTVRVEFNDRVYGILTVSSPKHFAQDRKEQKLLSEIADDIAYALNLIEIEDERIQTEKALRESEERYRSVFENTGAATVIIDKDKTISMANTQFEQLSGYSKEEVEAKKKWTEFVASEDLKRMKLYHTLRRKDETSAPTEYEFKFIDRKGNAKDIYCKIGMIPGTTRSVASWMDITNRKEAEKALQESEQGIRDLVENSLIGIGIIQDDKVIYRNPEQQRLLGPASQVTSPFNFENIHPNDVNKVKTLYQNLVTGQAQTLETDYRFYPQGKMLSKAGMKWVYCRSSLIIYKGEPAVLVNLLDITKAKELEHLLLIQDKMVSLGHMAAGIAHEIRNPLSGINIYLNTLEKLFHKRDSAEKEIEIVKRTQSASNKIESIIRRVMDFSKPSEPKLILRDINEPIKEALNLSLVTLRKSGIKIEESLGDNLPQCYIDHPLIEEVVLNLITNAADALRANTEDKIIRVISSKRQNSILLRVADSGPGIPRHIRDKVFDPFFTTKSDSSGIGLSIAYRIISDHGGSIHVDTSELGGAEFTIKIPIPKNGQKND
ncbi:PAS domain S-box protein [Acidobacteriota bacterium]